MTKVTIFASCQQPTTTAYFDIQSDKLSLIFVRIYEKESNIKNISGEKKEEKQETKTKYTCRFFILSLSLILLNKELD